MVIYKQRAINSGWVFHKKDYKKNAKFYATPTFQQYKRTIARQKSLYNNILPNNFKRFSYINKIKTNESQIEIKLQNNKMQTLYIATDIKKIPFDHFYIILNVKINNSYHQIKNINKVLFHTNEDKNNLFEYNVKNMTFYNNHDLVIIYFDINQVKLSSMKLINKCRFRTNDFTYKINNYIIDTYYYEIVLID